MMSISDIERFAEKVYVDPTGCWIWLAKTTKDGYGHFKLDGRMQLAHRVAYLAFVADIPAGYDVDHLCRERSCVNPGHLDAVTHAENVRRSARWITKCPKGHPYCGDNLYVAPNGGRFCRACNRAAVAAYRARRAAAA